MKEVALQVAEPRYSMSVMTENNSVYEMKQCFFLANVMFFYICFHRFLHRSGTLAFTINFTISPIMSYIVQILC